MSARGGSRAEACPGGHIGPPLRGYRKRSGTNGNCPETMPCPAGRDGARPYRGIGADLWRRGAPRERRGEVTPPYGSNAGGAQQRADVVGIGPYAPRGDEGRHAGSSCPTGGCGEPPRLPWVAAHSGAFAPRMGGMGGSRSRDHPQSAYQRRTIPQSRLHRASSLYTREPCPAGDGG